MRHPWRPPLFFLFLMIRSYHGSAAVEERTEAMMPAVLSPPEGNTTFVGGTTWCVAVAGASQVDLQSALDWACGPGKTDCSPIQRGGPCYEPDNILAHASFAFNRYYQQNGNSDIACNFGGTATITKRDPSYERCSFSVSEPERSAAPGILGACRWWRMMMSVVLLFVCLIWEDDYDHNATARIDGEHIAVQTRSCFPESIV